MHLSDRIGRRIRLQDLHVLMTVVQVGSMGKAAQRLNSSQPAISRSIAELEQVLGVRLLDRHSQGIEPTEYGRAFLECGAAVFDDLRRGVKNIEHLEDSTVGEVRIGTIAACAGSFVSAVIDRLSLRYPRVVFHVNITGIEALQRDLNERNIDLLIVQNFNLFDEEQVNFEILYDASYVIVASTKNPWARRRKVALTELLNESWVLPSPGGPVGSFAQSVFRAGGVDYPRATVFAPTPEIRMELVKTGRFLTIVSSSALKFPTKEPGIKVLPIKLRFNNAPIGIVTLKNRTLSTIAQRFVDDALVAAKLLESGKL